MTRITATLAMLIFFVTNVYSDYPYGEGTFDYGTANVQSFEVFIEGNVITVVDLQPCTNISRKINLYIFTPVPAVIRRNLVLNNDPTDFDCDGDGCFDFNFLQESEVFNTYTSEGTEALLTCGPEGLFQFFKDTRVKNVVSGGSIKFSLQTIWDGDSTSSFEIIQLQNPDDICLAGDFDGDGNLDVDDYDAIGTSLGLCASDANRDSIVDFSDLLIVINDWGDKCD